MAGAVLEVMRGSIDNVPVFELRETLSGAPLQPFSGPFFSDASSPLGKHFSVLNGDSTRKLALLKFFFFFVAWARRIIGY